MIFAKVTPNHAGIAIYGDYMDFENLYDALHAVVGDEGDFPHYETARIRVLGICYDLRHALMGHRGVEFIDNGMDIDKKREMSLLAPDKNVYLKIHVLMPEILFVIAALNKFLELYARKQTKTKYSNDLFTETMVVWDSKVVHVRNLQAAVAKCLKDTATEGSYARILNSLNGRNVLMGNYITQYIDLLNDRFINMTSEKRLKSISVFAKRITERDQEYIDLEDNIRKEAIRLNCHMDSLRLNIDYPEEIDW